MLNRFAFAILATAISMSPAAAQIRGTGASPGTFGIAATPGTMGGPTGIPTSGIGTAATAGFSGGVVVGNVRFDRGHGSARRAILLPYPYFYSDYGDDTGEAAQPQIVVVPTPAPTPSVAPPAPLESLLIEWRGDHFVRTIMSQKSSAAGQTAPEGSEKSAVRVSVPGRKNAAQPPRQLPPAVLVFRDGRQEQVSDYTIMGGTIYSKADYWTSGSWTRKIQIADLDVPATLKVNQERGLKFVLPASPNEVIIRP